METLLKDEWPAIYFLNFLQRSPSTFCSGVRLQSVLAHGTSFKSLAVAYKQDVMVYSE